LRVRWAVHCRGHDQPEVAARAVLFAGCRRGEVALDRPLAAKVLVMAFSMAAARRERLWHIIRAALVVCIWIAVDVHCHDRPAKPGITLGKLSERAVVRVRAAKVVVAALSARRNIVEAG